MGHSASAQADPTSCFHACAHPRRTQRPSQLPPTPSPPNPTPTPPPSNPTPQPPKFYCPPLPALHSSKPTVSTQSNETSDQRQPSSSVGTTPTVAPPPETKVSASTHMLPSTPSQPPLVAACREASDLLLGIQSKCSSRQIVGASHNRDTLTRASSCSDREAVCRTEEGESSGAGRCSARSRKLLLNKIEEIKQKYYQRELEIQICQDELQYEAQVGVIERLQRQYGGQLPLRSVNEIEGQRQKLRSRRLQAEAQGDSSGDLSKLIQNELELYSRDNSIEDSLRQSWRENRSPRGRDGLNGSRSGRQEVNRSSRSTCVLNNDSFEEKMEFSEYSDNQSLQQIRELDEEDEEYRSKLHSEGRTAEGNRRQESSRRQKEGLITVHRSRKQLQSFQDPTPTKQPFNPTSLSRAKSSRELPPPPSAPQGLPFSKSAKILLF